LRCSHYDQEAIEEMARSLRNQAVLRRYDQVELQVANNRAAALQADLTAANSKTAAAERAAQTAQAQLEARAKQLAAAEADAAAARLVIATLESRIADLHFVMAQARINSTTGDVSAHARAVERRQG
jgi:chromosome segregation ATPase